MKFDSSVIICDHFDDLTVKVERGEPIQVVRMVIWCIIYYFMAHITILTTWMGSPRSTFAVRWSKWSHTITALSNITYTCFWIILNEFFEDFQPIETILRFYCMVNIEISMKISPPHPNTTTNKIILWSKTFHSFSGMSLNMSGISWIFYEGLGVLGGWEIGFEVKKTVFLRYTDQYPPLVSDRPDIWSEWIAKTGEHIKKKHPG